MTALERLPLTEKSDFWSAYEEVMSRLGGKDMSSGAASEGQDIQNVVHKSSSNSRLSHREDLSSGSHQQGMVYSRDFMPNRSQGEDDFEAETGSGYVQNDDVTESVSSQNSFKKPNEIFMSSPDNQAKEEQIRYVNQSKNVIDIVFQLQVLIN